MRLAAAIQGDLAKIMRAEHDHLALAATTAVTATADDLKRQLRRQVTSAGFGNRLANTIRANVYPKGRPHLGAAALVYTRAPKIIEAFETGATIRGHGRYLAIPTEAVPRRRGRRLTPAEIEASGIKLRFVPARRGRPALLVADEATVGRTGRVRSASARARRTGSGLATVVLFLLVPQVKLPKRLDWKGAGERAGDALAETFVKEANRE